jgi:hypothetical protein
MEGTILAFAVAATDPDSMIPSLSVRNLPQNAAFSDSGNGHGYFYFAPDYSQSGIYDIRFLASDGFLVDTEVVRITVFDAGNQRPVIDPIGPRAVNENQHLEFIVTSHDADMTIPVLSTSTLPRNASFVSHGDGTGTFAFNPDFTQSGLYTVLFIAFDGQLADTEAVPITVIDVGRPPVLAAIGSQTVREGDSLHVLLSATDPDNDSLYFGGINLPSNAMVLNTGRTSGALSFHPSFSQSGIYNVIIFVSDGVNRDSESVAITVTEAGNQPPVFITQDSMYTVFERDSLGILIVAQDPDNDSLAFDESSLPFNSTLLQLNRNTAIFSFKPARGQAGNYSFTVTISDSQYSVTKNFYVRVVATGNRPPVFALIGPQTVIEGDSLIFTVSATDPDGITPPSLSIARTLPRSQFTDHGNGTGTFDYRPNYYDSGIDTAIFIATDDLGMHAMLIVQITTSEFNIAPSLYYIGDTIIFEGGTLQATLRAYDSTDAVGGQLYLSATRLPQNATFVDNRDRTGTFAFMPGYSQAGRDSAVFRVIDAGQPPLENSITMHFTILDRNRPPILVSLGSYEIDQAETLLVALSASDPDGDSIFLSLWNYPTPPRNCSVIDSGNGTGVLKFAPDYTQAGIFLVNVRATDRRDSYIRTAYIFVNDLGNQQPTLNHIPDTLSVIEGETLAVNIISTDPDSTRDSIYVQGLPRYATMDYHGDGTATFRFAPFFNQSGNYPLLFVVVDPQGLADSQQVMLRVIEAGIQRPALSNITNKTVGENGNLTFGVSATDADSTIPILRAKYLPPNATFIDSANGRGAFIFNPSYYQSGSYGVLFRALDAQDTNFVDSLSVNIIVQNVNQPPVIYPAGPFSVMEGDSLHFLVRAFDPDSVFPILRQASALLNSAFYDSGNGVGLFSFHPDFNQSGNRSVVFRAMDRQDTTVSRTTMVQVNVIDYNRPPVLDSIPADTTIFDGTILTYSIRATDADNIVPRLSVTPLPAHATFTDNRNSTGIFRYTTTVTDVGVHNLMFKAVDGSNTAFADSQLAIIRVLSTGLHPPKFDSIQTSYVISPNRYFVLLPRATDPDSQSITMSYFGSIPLNATFIDSGNGKASFVWIPDTTQVGLWTINFLATDPNSFADTLSIQLNVINYKRGDVNGDGQLTGADVIYLVAYFKGQRPAPIPLARADANGDGLVNGADVIYLVRYFKGIGPPPPPLKSHIGVIKNDPVQSKAN